MINQIKQHRLVQELSANVRLQWMLLAVLAILVLSSIKAGFDSLAEQDAEVSRQQAMVTKLLQAANRPLTEAMLASVTSSIELIKLQAPKAGSVSIAEAEALASANEALIKQRVSRAQAKLIGSETLNMGKETFWQVRIQITGRMHELNLIPMLENFDGSKSFIRLQTLNFRPEAGGALDLVVDYLYRQESKE